MIYAVENGDYAVTDHVPRCRDAPENLVQSLRLLLTLPRAGLLSSAGRRGGRLRGRSVAGRTAGAGSSGCLGCARRAGVGGAHRRRQRGIFRLWVREEEREVTVAL